MQSSASQLVSTTGRYLLRSVLKRSVAPAATNRLTWLRRWTAPVRKVPAGTTTRPPPAWWQAAIALAIAAVQSVVPSPTAPKPVIGKSRAGKVGTVMRATIASARAQGLATNAAHADVHKAGASSAAVPRPEAARNERRERRGSRVAGVALPRSAPR